MILEICALSLIEDCVITLNYLYRGDYSGGAKFQNGSFAFCLFYAGIDKRNGKKIQFERAQNMLLRFTSHFSKKDVKVFLAELVNLLISGGSLRLMLLPLIPKITMESVSRIKRIDYRIQERLNN